MINFSVIDIEIPDDFQKERVQGWLKNAIVDEGKILGELNYQFVSDSYLHNINVDFLDHDTLTDIITFPNVNDYNIVSGDLFISLDRIKENAIDGDIPFLEELHRVIIHGVLHLIGFDDKTKEDIIIMREKENYYLNNI